MLDTNIGRGCGGKMFNMDGTIMSPMYPMVYNKSSTCRWDIAVPRPKAIRVQFKSMYHNNIIYYFNIHYKIINFFFTSYAFIKQY